MANAELVALLKQGSDAWNNWRQEWDKEHPLKDWKTYTNNLELLDLHGADFGGANLRKANLVGVDLSRAHLLRADLREADLRGANLIRADLSEADLSGANLIQADLTGARLFGANVSEANLTRVQWDRAHMRGNYLAIRGIDSCYGNALFRRAAADQDFLDTLELRWALTWRIWLFRAWGLIDYGRSLSRVSLLALGLATFFGVIYSIWPEMLNNTTWADDRFTPFYFSIVTYTTLGMGDINPKGHLFGEIVVSLEVIVGYATLGLLLAVLAEKIARRS